MVNLHRRTLFTLLMLSITPTKEVAQVIHECYNSLWVHHLYLAPSSISTIHCAVCIMLAALPYSHSLFLAYTWCSIDMDVLVINLTSVVPSRNKLLYISHLAHLFNHLCLCPLSNLTPCDSSPTPLTLVLHLVFMFAWTCSPQHLHPHSFSHICQLKGGQVQICHCCKPPPPICEPYSCITAVDNCNCTAGYSIQSIQVQSIQT